MAAKSKGRKARKPAKPRKQQKHGRRVPAKKPGRPTLYSQELAARICELVIDGNSLRTICALDGLPAKSTVLKWLAENPEFSDQYARAREEQADSLADEMVDIADGARHLDAAGVQAARLRVDTRKWVASKLKPRKYGDKLELEGDFTHHTPDDLRGRFVGLLNKFGVAADDAGGTAAGGAAAGGSGTQPSRA